MIRLDSNVSTWKIVLDHSPAQKAVLAGDGTLAVGLGEKCDGETETIRKSTAKAVKTLKGLGVYEASLSVEGLLEEYGEKALEEVVLGAELSQYVPETLKSEKKEKKSFVLHIAGDGGRKECVDKALVLSDAVCFARTLVNRPANYLTPQVLSSILLEKAEEYGLEASVLTEDDCRALGMGAFLAVSESSGNRGCITVLRYNGGGDSSPVALVGKAVCYDSGGYSLKERNGLKRMYTDMAGGAAVAAAVIAAARNNVKANIIAVIPAVENRISPTSYLPGDVITSMSGKTIEIGSTDAEGRMILADSITYAIRNEGCSRVLDIATLTGSMANTLGWVASGVFSNDEDFYASFMEAGRKAGEKYWRFPLWEEYSRMIGSTSGDMYNTSKESSGGITAAKFLENFAEKKPWIHVDIAGSAWSEAPKREYQTEGATGTAVLTLYNLCESAGA